VIVPMPPRRGPASSTARCTKFSRNAFEKYRGVCINRLGSASLTDVSTIDEHQRNTSLGITSRQGCILVYQSMYMPNCYCSVVYVWIRPPHGVSPSAKALIPLRVHGEVLSQSLSAVESAAADQVGVPRPQVTFCYLPNNQVW
jgi:hypothetical protein